MTSGIYLAAYLAPLQPWLERDDITDIWINRPGEAWFETTTGEIQRDAAPDLTETALARLARQIAAASHQGVNREQPLLSASLPDGARVQIVGPPATRGPLALAVRKHTLSDLSLADLGRAGAFRAPASGALGGDADLQALLEDIFPDLDPQTLVDPASITPVRFHCPCSRSRSVSALKLLGRDELSAMLREDGQAELTCHFCSAVYRVEADELLELIRELAPA
jgi:hypothetical protein